jgi:hypothetical protein
MRTPVPTRITIELHPGDDGRPWTASTEVDGGRAAAPVAIAVRSAESDVPWTPQAYEAAPCTCGDGVCDRDHEND